MIESKQLDIGYKQQGILLHSNIETSLKSGELTCLLGPNGAGKSTLLKTFAGILEPIGGLVSIEGKNINKYKLSELACKISVVLTDRSQLMNMQVEELVASGRHPYTGFFGKLRKTDFKIIDTAIEQVGLEKLSQRKLYELSDGERQKAMIAKALAQETQTILLDEPTAFLDLPSKIEVMRLLHKLAVDSNKAILMSTHDMDLALKFADKLWLMAKDMPMVTGTTEDLVMEDKINEFFGKNDIYFDKKSGSFKIKNGLYKKVKLTGEGTEAIWLSNALMRNGISISEEADVEIRIISKDKREFEILENNVNKSFANTIEEVIRILRDLL